MKHKKFDKLEALRGCRFCAAIWLMKVEESNLDRYLKMRLEEIINGA